LHNNEMLKMKIIHSTLKIKRKEKNLKISNLDNLFRQD